MKSYDVLGFLLIFLVVALTGCENGMKNVEERDYATILLATEGQEVGRYHFVLGVAQEKVVGEKSMVEEISEWDAENLKELAEKYGDVKGKELNLSHLKVILLCSGEGDLPQWQKNLLTLLDGEDEIAKTCPVLQLDDYEGFLTFLKEEEEPVGEYVENLVRIQEKQGVDVSWLMDYQKALLEDDTVTMLHLLQKKEGWNIR
jgi:hypothetical protein